MPKVAIIEDDLAIIQMYRMKFVNEGFEVVTAENGELGLALIKAENPDMVLLDLMMPVMTGPEMLEKLRATDWGKKVPVIILTNMGEEEAPKSINALQVERFIVKADMTPKEVADLVKETLAA